MANYVTKVAFFFPGVSNGCIVCSVFIDRFVRGILDGFLM